MPTKPHGAAEGHVFTPSRAEMTKRERFHISQPRKLKKAFQLTRAKMSIRSPPVGGGADDDPASPRAPRAERSASAERAMALHRQLLASAEHRAYAVRKVALVFSEIDASLFT